MTDGGGARPQSVAYAWDSPPARAGDAAGGSAGVNKLAVEVEGSSPLVWGHFDLDRVGEHRGMGLTPAGGPLFTARVRCDGPTLVLTLVHSLLHPAVAAPPSRPPPRPPHSPLWPPLPVPSPTLRPASAGLQPGRLGYVGAGGGGEGSQAMVKRQVRGGRGVWWGSVTVRLAGVGVTLIDSDAPRCAYPVHPPYTPYTPRTPRTPPCARPLAACSGRVYPVYPWSRTLVALGAPSRARVALDG
jgi:hypothetical protein